MPQRPPRRPRHKVRLSYLMMNAEEAVEYLELSAELTPDEATQARNLFWRNPPTFHVPLDSPLGRTMEKLALATWPVMSDSLH